MSLTQKIRKRNEALKQARQATDPGLAKEPTPQKNMEAKMLDDTLSSLDENCTDVYDFKYTCFISDKKMDHEMRSKLDDFPKIKIWNEQFQNRSFQQLADKGVSSCWINLADKKAKNWLQLNILQPKPFTTILVWNGSKKQKYIADLADSIDVKIRGVDIHKLKSLSFTDLLSQSLNFHRIHSPAGKLDSLLSCIGCSSNLKRSHPND